MDSNSQVSSIKMAVILNTYLELQLEKKRSVDLKKCAHGDASPIECCGVHVT